MEILTFKFAEVKKDANISASQSAGNEPSKIGIPNPQAADQVQVHVLLGAQAAQQEVSN